MDEQERLTIKSRQTEGIAPARLKEEYIGKLKIQYPDNWLEVYKWWKGTEQ